MTVARDSSKRRRDAWSSIVRRFAEDDGGEPQLPNPTKTQSPEQCRSSATVVPRWATQCDGFRCIHLAWCSQSLTGMVVLIQHNGVHCREQGWCEDVHCNCLCNSDHWGLEIILTIRGVVQQEQPKPPKNCRNNEHWLSVAHEMRHLLAYWVEALGPVQPQLRMHNDPDAQSEGMELLALGLEALHYKCFASTEARKPASFTGMPNETCRRAGASAKWHG